MAINETIQKGAYYRHCTGFDPEGNPQYARISFWTDSSDVGFDDGETLEEIIDDLKGQLEGTIITKTLNVGETSLEFENSIIKYDDPNLKCHYYTSLPGVNITSIRIEDGKMTLGFDPQEETAMIRVELYSI